MENTFVMLSAAGPRRDFSKETREQPFWDDHAAFIDKLVAEGFILFGGPLVEEGGALLIVKAQNEDEVRERTKNDPWYQHGILRLESVKRWQIFIDTSKQDVSAIQPCSAAS
ncbi:MAG: YciI family protein [Thermomicrobiales bacterium]